MPETAPQIAAPAGPAAAARPCDVLIVGGGPAGSTAAILLAEQGYRVVVLEKTHHPRFHIGESLLPANLPLLQRLGVARQVHAIGMQKWGAEFISPWDWPAPGIRIRERLGQIPGPRVSGPALRVR